MVYLLGRVLRYKLVIVAVAALVGHAVAAPPQNNLLSLLQKAQTLVEDGRITEALTVLDEGQALAANQPRKNVTAVERYRWEVAITHLDFANQLTNSAQYREYARRARQKWKEYIDWYTRLSAEERSVLPAVRIMAASQHLGNSIIRTEEPRDLFTEYADIQDARYLNSESLDLWKTWLYACPEMRPVASRARSAQLRAEKVCLCCEEWRLYAEVLQEWAEANWESSRNITPPSRTLSRRLRESGQVFEAINQCSQ